MTAVTAHRNREIDLAPLREAFQRSGKSPADVARELGWTTHKGDADGPRVKRALGLRPYTAGGRPGETFMRKRCSYDTAVRLAEAIGVDPADVGL